MIHLASQSPRRRLLLEQIGIDYRVVDAPIDERMQPGESPERFVVRMACEKALAGVAAIGDRPAAPVLAADTAVVLEGQVMGKPRDEAHAMAMLGALSGKMHHVFSAVAMTGIRAHDAGHDRTDDDGSEQVASAALRVMTSVSRVWFREIPRDEIRAYCASSEPLDKAGAYAIQGRAAVFVTRLDGSFSGVMGLPLYETASLLRAAGIHV